jgi:RNA polymerase sigma factor (sigma-70 family)
MTAVAENDSERQALVAELAAQHGQTLRRYLSDRIRNRADVPDLAQEVYLRLLRVGKNTDIHSAEAYLFTVATNLVYEHTVRQSAAPTVVAFDDVASELYTADEADPAEQAVTQQRFDALERAIGRLTPKTRTALLLHRREGMTLGEIGEQLVISRNVVKKHLAKALLYCRNNLRKE